MDHTYTVIVTLGDNSQLRRNVIAPDASIAIANVASSLVLQSIPFISLAVLFGLPNC